VLIFLHLKYIITLCININRGIKLEEIDVNFKDEIIKKKDILNRISQSKFGVNISKLKISYNLKGQRAGIVNPVKKEIRLNFELCNKFPEKMINDVLVHEAAHYINFCLNPSIKPHGNEWKFIAKTLGLNNLKATHDMPTTKARKVKLRAINIDAGVAHIRLAPYVITVLSEKKLNMPANTVVKN